MNRSDPRTFLGLDSDFLAAVARTLLAEHGRALGALLVLVPGRRAGRKLLEALLLQAEGAIEPPRIVTEASLAEQLSAAAVSPASPAAIEWTWFEVLGRAAPAELECFAARRPGGDDFSRRLGLARQLVALDRERASLEGAQTPARTNTGELSERRLSALSLLSTRVSQRLAQAGRSDPARGLAALRDLSARRAGVQLVLAGMVEISPALRALLQTHSPRPRVLIQAGADLAASFDEFGGLIPQAWEQRAIPLPADTWLAVDDPAAAVAAALEWVAQLPEGTRSDELAIGVHNERLLPRLTHAFARQGQPLHAAAGERSSASAPWLALDALQAWLAREDFAALAAALRHPAIERALCAQAAAGSAVALLDLWHSEHLPDSLSGALPGSDAASEEVRRLRTRLGELCGELSLTRERPLLEWLGPIAALLCRLFPGVEAGTRESAALHQLAELCNELGSFAPDFWPTPLSAQLALRLCLDWSADLSLPLARSPGSVEALGWLELAMENAPQLLLIGLNDGWVPQAQRSDSALGAALEEDAAARWRARLARDVHLLTVLASRRGSGLKLLSLRRGPGDEPLRPSRLLFHADERTAIARARAFFAEGQQRIAARAPTFVSARGATSSLPLPHLPPMRAVSITSFKQYLSSPYLYYLQRVLELERVRDDAWELDARGFGTLVHDVLERFGHSELRDSSAEPALEALLHAELEQLAQARFGPRPLPAVRLQLQQLRRRLSAFAQAQAQQAREGWRIHEVEKKLEAATLDVDGQALRISGRIDRIDRHQDGRRWRILDYKSGNEEEPRKAHVTKNGWKDLQLPLYWHCLKSQLPGEIQLGYFMVPPRLEDCRVQLARFDAEELDQALELARAVLRKIAAHEFAELGRARPGDRVQRALCGLSLLALEDVAPHEGNDSAEPLE